MSRESVQTLFHPFEIGELDAPAEGTCLVFGAERDFQAPGSFRPVQMKIVQGVRPEFVALEKRGLCVTPQPEGSGYTIALILAGKHRGQNERWLAEAIRRVSPGGIIVAAGGKMEGVASLRKRLEKDVPLGGHLSKNHGIVFWFTPGEEASSFAEGIIRDQDNAALIEGRFEAAPGMFSHDRIDVGSRLLADQFRSDLRGIAADFCAGWGYLSVILAERTSVSRVDLYEADHASLEAARLNMGRITSKEARFHWSDLAADKVERIYDLIVMNPPFHQGRAADAGLGQAMIRAAAVGLKPRGRLLMVANRGLPYEALLKSQFAACEMVAEEKGFRVYSAVR